MTLVKAINIISDAAYAGTFTFNQDFKLAASILIQAGQFIVLSRVSAPHLVPKLLHSEAKD